MRTLYIAALLVLFSFSIYSQQKEDGLEAINETTVKAQLEFLASDWMEGRETGTRGAYMAADYLSSMFKIYGLAAAGDVETISPSWRERRAGVQPEEIATYFQNFSLLEYDSGNDQLLSVITEQKNYKEKINFNYKTDFNVRTSTVGIEAESPVVFVGYGFKDDEYGYNDFEDVDVKGKIILRLSGYPGHLDTSSEAYKNFKPKGRWGRWSLYRSKSKFAQEAGALVVLEVDLTEDNSIEWANNFPFRYNYDYYEGTEPISSGIRKRLTILGDSVSKSPTTITITPRIANELIKESGIDFEKIENEIAQKLKPQSKVLKNKLLYLKTSVESNIIKARNVLGMIEGENPNEVIVVGAHYDHVGMNMGYIWNGSDDNASGTVGMLTLAKAFAESGIKPKRTIIFAGWTGEEEGLLGSEYFVNNFTKDKKIVLNLNYDMISRDSEGDTLGVECGMTLTQIDTTAPFQKLTDQFNEELKLGLKIDYDASKKPGGGSDHASFSEKGIPILYLMAGWPDEYHRPADHPDLANIEKMTKIIKIGYNLIWYYANSTAPINP